MVDFIINYSKEIAALLVPILKWVLDTRFPARANLQVSNPYSWQYTLPPKPTPENSMPTALRVNAQSVLIRNAGRLSAHRIELAFKAKPMCINFWPIRNFKEEALPDNAGYSYVFDDLAPDAVIGCELLEVEGAVPDLVTVRCAECNSTFIQMYPQPVISTRARRTNAVLQFAGWFLLVYLGIALVQLMVLKTTPLLQ